MTPAALAVHEDWASPGFDLPALAADTGPFVRRSVLRAWHRHRGNGGDVMLVEHNEAFLPLFAEDGTIRFLGEADLTDYHSPLGRPDAVRTLAGAFFADLSPGTSISLDSLPEEAAAPLVAGLADAGIDAETEQHEVAAVLALPASFDDWLAGIGKKERHEVRRKRRRFQEDLGPPVMVRADGTDAVAMFAAMHRRAAGEKGTFMTAETEALFADLQASAGAFVDVLTSDAGDPVAAAFGFEDDRGYYLYNSAYEPAARNASPGIVMLAALIERAIDRGAAVFDFLKGDETYKFRHGAEPRPLYAVTAEVPS